MNNLNIKKENNKEYSNEKHLNYLEHIWFVMHHSKDPKRKALALTCYLDESGTDRNNDINNVTAVLGGIVLDKEAFFAFDRKWQKLLTDKKIESPLHMKEFGIHGRFSHFTVEDRRVIFTEVANIVNRYKRISIAASLTKKQFDTYMPKKISDHMGIYGSCFQLLVQVWKHYANDTNQKDNIAIILDDGNEHKNHISNSRDAILEKQKHDNLYVGSITFGDDKELSPLQGADVISWGVRRIWNDQSLNKGFEPIARIYEKNHFEMKWDEDMLKGVADYMMPVISEERS